MFTVGRIVLSSQKRGHVDWNWPISREKYLKIDCFVKMPLQRLIREFNQIATAGATTAAVTERVWGEYVSVDCQILAKRNTNMSET